MDPLLQILKERGRLPTAELAKLTGKSEPEVEKAVRRFESDRVILVTKLFWIRTKQGMGVFAR
jgi:DNA-binding Lrp family transcriptional regulator